jgi:signal transduction histidine kinase
MDAGTLRGLGLLDGLDDGQLTELAERATEVPVEPGVVLFREGEHADHWWVLLDGALDLVRRIGAEDVVVARMDAAGRWAGGFRAWDDQGVYLATGRGAVPGRVLRLAADDLRACLDAWFPFGGHLVRGLYHTARSIESTARQRSALVTLGTLSAGLAHEINNPAAAATRAVDALEEATDAVTGSLPRLVAAGLGPDQVAALDDLRRRLRAGSGATDPLDRADTEDALSGWLGGRGVPDGRSLGRVLADAGADVRWCDEVAAAVPDEALPEALGWVASTLSAAASLTQVKESTRRISELVAAVRSYSQMDRGSLQRIDVHEGLESTLTMLGHQLRDVTVRRDFGDVPEIEAYPGELNQVWTNLVDNAVDAMDGRGTLVLCTTADGDGVLVEVTDSGAGMPPDVAARVFEPFFTTKGVGKGTGLGLDIAHRIVVERHGGTIDVESRPGATTFRVRLRSRPAT